MLRATRIARFDDRGKRTDIREKIVHVEIAESFGVTVLVDVFHELPKLTKVTVRGRGIIDISVLLKYDIKSLDLRCDLIDSKTLCSMSSLEKLNVETIDVDTLKKLVSLKNLTIYNKCSSELLYVLPPCLEGLMLPIEGVLGEIDVDKVDQNKTMLKLCVGKGSWKSFIERFPNIRRLSVNGGYIGVPLLSNLEHLSLSRGVLDNTSFFDSRPTLKSFTWCNGTFYGDIERIWKLPLRKIVLYNCRVKIDDEHVSCTLKLIRPSRPL